MVFQIEIEDVIEDLIAEHYEDGFSLRDQLRKLANYILDKKQTDFYTFEFNLKMRKLAKSKMNYTESRETFHCDDLTVDEIVDDVIRNTEDKIQMQIANELVDVLPTGSTSAFEIIKAIKKYQESLKGNKYTNGVKAQEIEN
jgi:hypothetical protein